MKTFTCLFIFLVLYSNKMYSQTQMICEGVPLAKIYEAIQAEDGNYFILSIGTDNLLYLIKYNSSNNIIWVNKMVRDYGTPILKIVGDAEYVFFRYNDQSWICSYNSSGNLMFSRTYDEIYETLYVENDLIVLCQTGGSPYGNPKSKILILNIAGEQIGSHEELVYDTEYSNIYIDINKNIWVARDINETGEDGSGHITTVYKHTDLLKLTSVGNLIWEFQNLHNANTIKFIYADNNDYAYVYLEDYKMKFDKNGSLLADGPLSDGDFSTVIYNFIPCAGLQLAAIDLIHDKFYSCRFNEDDPFEYDFQNIFPFEVLSYGYSVPDYILDPKGYITYAFIDNDDFILRCYDINGNQQFAESIGTFITNDNRVYEILQQNNGRVFGFYHLYEDIYDYSTYSLFRLDADVSYPALNLAPYCPIVESCEMLKLNFDPLNKYLTANLSPDGIYNSEVDYEIYNSAGQIIQHFTGDEDISVYCGSFPKGLYIVKASFKEINYCNQKFVVY